MRNTLLLLLLVLFSCQKDNKEYTTYRSLKNSHYCVPKTPVFCNENEVYFSFKVNESFYYEHNGNNGYSKIFGFSESINPHKESARVVYVLRDNLLYVGYYCYVNSVSPQETTGNKGDLFNIKSDSEVFSIISLSGGYYNFRVWDNIHDTIVRVKTNAKEMNYYCHPHVGGQYYNNDFYVNIKLYDN